MSVAMRRVRRAARRQRGLVDLHGFSGVKFALQHRAGRRGGGDVYGQFVKRIQHRGQGRLLLRLLGNEKSGEQGRRSEEHTSELQSLRHLVCRLLLEKKKKKEKIKNIESK